MKHCVVLLQVNPSIQQTWLSPRISYNRKQLLLKPSNSKQANVKC